MNLDVARVCVFENHISWISPYDVVDVLEREGAEMVSRTRNRAEKRSVSVVDDVVADPGEAGFVFATLRT